MLARLMTRSRTSLIFASVPSKLTMIPCSMPNSRNATTMDSTVSDVRMGLRHRPAQINGKYFIRSPFSAARQHERTNETLRALSSTHLTSACAHQQQPTDEAASAGSNRHVERTSPNRFENHRAVNSVVQAERHARVFDEPVQ